MKKVVFIFLPLIALFVFIIGNSLPDFSFREMILLISELDLKVPNFVEIQESLATIKTLFSWQADTIFGNIFNILLGVTQIGNLLTECVKVAYHFIFDTIWNVVQILRAFALA